MIPNRKKIIAFVLAFAVLAAFGVVPCSGATAKQKYLAADGCYRKLLKNPRHQKYRDRWLRCIKKFEAVHRHNPSGPWAAAGLYMSGRLYLELYKHSFKASDQTEALDIFQRVVKRYPKSRYSPKAAQQIRAVTGKAPAKPVHVSPQSVPRKADRAKALYLAADACYRELLKNPRLQKYRDRWLKCIEKFEAAHDRNPAGPWAAAGLYMAGRLYEELYAKSYRKADKRAAVAYYEKVVKQFPDSDYHQKAAAALGRPVPPKPQKQPEPQKQTDAIAGVIDKASAASPAVDETAGDTTGKGATVQGLRYWSNPSYTRVVIDADRAAHFTHRLLKKDPTIQKPQRLYVDLNNCRLGSGIKKTIPINDNLLKDARAGQFTPDTVRVVVDINSFRTYKIFSLRNPFRIVIDVWGDVKKAPAQRTDASLSAEKPSPSDLAKQLALGVSRIVVDPGHGGKDFGAPGYLKGVHEKYIVLEIAQRLADKIRKKIGCEVIMTRTTDRYLTLEERTAIANTKNADLFISIHTNSARSRKAYGIETFFLNLATDDDAILVAARENATSRKNISDLQTILSDLMQNAKINESSRLASIVQKNLHGHLKKRFSKIKNKGVKQAPFYVLLGAQMPAILVETSFISNPRECRRLKTTNYQDHLCEGILKGIQQYIREINPSARFSPAAREPSKG